MNTYQKFLANTWVRRVAVLATLVLVLWLARSLMSMILLTFIFSFLVTRRTRWTQRRIHVKATYVVVPIYLLVVWGLYYVLTRYVPMIVVQSIKLVDSMEDFYNSKAFDNNTVMQWFMQQANSMILNEQLKNIAGTVVTYVGNIGGMVFTAFMSLLLSFFFTIGLDDIDSFGNSFLNSRFSWYFRDVKYLADKFINTFGVVMEAQILIAIVNTAITTVTLVFMHMPNVVSLAIMVFILSLIPVAGAIVSAVPLSLIAYTVGGWRDVITIIIMIVIIHALEAYVLNPKFMSTRTQLPIFVTFVVLMVAEHIWGTWGLIVGLPVFTFLLDMLEVKQIKVPKQHRHPHKQGATNGK